MYKNILKFIKQHEIIPTYTKLNCFFHLYNCPPLTISPARAFNYSPYNICSQNGTKIQNTSTIFASMLIPQKQYPKSSPQIVANFPDRVCTI